MSQRHPAVLESASSALLIVDVQERFRSAIADFEAMARGCGRLARAFRILSLPVFVTEQYPRGLGKTVPEVLEGLRSDGGPGDAIPEKTAFSSCGAPDLPERIRSSGVRALLVCGIEAQVCVNQTVHDLLAAGYRVHVAADAVSSRHTLDREVALRKMERSGAMITTAEMAAFELLVDAKHPKFKEVQALFK